MSTPNDLQTKYDLVTVAVRMSRDNVETWDAMLDIDRQAECRKVVHVAKVLTRAIRKSLGKSRGDTP